MSLAADENDLFRRAAFLVDQILRGSDPAHIAVEEPTKFIVDDERIRHGLRDRRDVLFVTDAAHYLCARLLETLD